MLFLVSFFAALLAAGVTAQSSNTYTPPSYFDPSQVDDSRKSSWCNGQLSSCPKICDGFTQQNKCNVNDLTFVCTCQDGSSPNVAEYENTLPFYICQEAFGQCIAAHPNDAAGQKQCKDDQKQCGTKKAEDGSDDDDSSSTTGASTTLRTATATPEETQASQTESGTGGASPTESGNAGAAVYGREVGTGIVAAMFVAAFL